MNETPWREPLLASYAITGKRNVIYIAGPYRGVTPWDVECNIRAAEAIAFEVAKTGNIPLCPHSMYRYFDKALPDEYWLEITTQLLSPCDAIVMCPGWEDSAGSVCEYNYALDHKLPVHIVK